MPPSSLYKDKWHAQTNLLVKIEEASGKSKLRHALTPTRVSPANSKPCGERFYRTTTGMFCPLFTARWRWQRSRGFSDERL
eukprot:scaffold480306_cov31-Prasinocladus_malaysianus.AAC.1